jgi:putative membrane protein
MSVSLFPRRTPTSVAVGSAALLLAMMTGAKDLSSADQKFIDTAMHAGLAEVQVAELAAQQAQSRDLREVAHHLGSDHEEANKELADIAHRNDVTAPNEPRPEDKETMERLKKLSGGEFDREYVQQQLEAHHKAIDLFSREASEGRNPEVRDYARKVLPKLKQHLSMLEDVEGKKKNAKRY